jgi:outer membrane beta-barrel protein
MKAIKKTLFRFSLLWCSHLFAAVLAAADDAEQVDLQAVRNRYWARGEESEVSVVQNRQFAKSHRFDLGVSAGMVSSDPFLAVTTIGGSFGYHFNEYVSAHLVGWKHFVSSSTALKTFEETLGATTNNNPPRSYIGAEALASLLYGKLSVLGKSILYYDLHVSAGLGRFETDTGAVVSPSVGIGQQIHLSQNLSLRVDYRLQYYRETIVEKVITPRLGQVVGERDNWSNNVTLGLQFRFGNSEKPELKK